jgi:threonine dehydratase
MSVSVQAVEKAAKAIGDATRKTPLFRSEQFERRVGSKYPIYFKAESLQHTGSFKVRGALNKLLNVLDSAKQKGVITASAGNHAQGVAYHAHRLGVKSKIVMPVGSPLTKISATKQWGAEVVLSGESFQEAYNKAVEIQEKEGQEFIHPFDDELIMAGQGTIAKEIWEDLPEVEVFVAPIGGGGLLAGCGTYFKEKNPHIKIYGVQAEGCSTFLPSLKTGKPVTLDKVNTIAEGMSAKKMGDKTFEVCKEIVDDCILVSDEEIAEGLLWLLENARLFVEGCAGASWAGVVKKPELITGPTVVLLSGGNLDVNLMARVIEKGMNQTGRLIQLEMRLPDMPGELEKLAHLFAEEKTSIVDIRHERVFGQTKLRETLVSVSLETSGFDHCERIHQALEAAKYHPRLI